MTLGAGAGGRHPGRRRHRHHREHQLASGAGQGRRDRDHGRRPSDRHAGVRVAAVHLHRVRADVLPAGRGAVPVRADGAVGDVRDDLLVPAVAHAGADDGQVPASPPCPAYRLARQQHGAARSRNPLVRFQRGFEDRGSSGCATAIGPARTGARSSQGFRRGFMAFVLASFPLVPFLGQNFFPAVDGGQILIHARCRSAPRGGKSAVRFADRSRKRSAKSSRPTRSPRWSTTSDAAQRHQPHLQQHRRDRHAGRRHPDRCEGP
jgi:hypothetical protein